MKYIGTMLSVFQRHNCICQVIIWTPEGPISYASESHIVIFLPWYNCCVYVLNGNKMFLNWNWIGYIVVLGSNFNKPYTLRGLIESYGSLHPEGHRYRSHGTTTLLSRSMLNFKRLHTCQLPMSRRNLRYLCLIWVSDWYHASQPLVLLHSREE